MHELTIISNLAKIILDEARSNEITRITRVELVVGRMHQLVPDLLTIAFESITRGTPAEGAKLDIEWRNVLMLCQNCQHQFAPEGWIFICPQCGAVSLTQLSGKELFVKSIEGE